MTALITAAEIEKVGGFGIKAATVRQWKRRGKIKPVRRGPHGAWLYRLEDLRRVALDSRSPNAEVL